MTSPRDVDSGWAWIILCASFFNHLMCSGLAFVAGMFQVIFLHEFTGSVALTSWVTGLFSALLQLSGPLSGGLSNTLGCRVAVMTGGCLLAIGFFLSGMVDSLEWLLVFFGLLAGIGNGLTYTASVVVVSFYFEKRRTLVNGIASSSGGLGVLLAPQLCQALLDNFSWRETLFILAGISAQITVVGALMFPIHEKPTGCRKPGCGKSEETETIVVKLENEMIGFTLSQKDDIPECSNRETILNQSHFYEKNGTNIMCTNSNSRNNNDAVSLSELRFSLPRQNNGFETSKQILGAQNSPVVTLSKSHEALARIPLLERLAEKGTSASHQELNTESLFGNRDSRNRHKSGSKLIVISQNPSLASVISSTHHLHIRVSNAGDDDSSAIEHDNHQNSLGNNWLQQKLTLDLEESLVEQQPEDGSLRQSLKVKRPHLPLYRNRLFLVLCLALFINSCGAGTFVIHAPSFLHAQDFTDRQVTNILSINGLAILFGRCLIGALVNSMPGSEVLFLITMHLLGGLFVMLFPVLGTTYIPAMVMMFASASYCGTLYSLLPTLTIQYVGLTGLTTAFGIEMVCCGLGFLVSPPLAGMIVDVTNSYDYNIYCGGFLFSLAGFVLMLLPCMSKKTSD